MERFAPRYDPLGFTLLMMVAAFAVLVVAALPTLEVPHGWTVWGALLVTGVFASALAFLVQTWAQRRTSANRTALVFTLEPVWAALFGFTLAGDRLGALGWAGCAVIMAGIVLAEPAAADVLVAARAPAAHGMTAVVLALASAAFFGAMTVAIRIGLRDGGGAATGTLATLLPALARRARRGRRRGTTLHHAWAFLLAGLIAPGCSQILFTLSIREAGASRTSVAVATAPLFAIALALLFLDEPLEVPLVLGALAIVGGGVALASERERARAPPARRSRLRDRRERVLRGARQPRPRAARACEPRDGRGRDAARGGAAGARSARAACRATASCAASRRRESSSGSRTSASSRRTSTAA